MSTISSFKDIENKYDIYVGKDFMKKFCESLREHPKKKKKKKIKKKKMKSLTNDQQNLLYL